MPDALAFVDITVIPMDRKSILPHQTVLVRDGHIISLALIDKFPIPNDAISIDGKGKYLLPGLADMHVHLEDEDDLILLLANGVTMVRNMAGMPLVLKWRDEIAQGQRIGPRIYTAGPIIDGTPSTARNAVVIETKEDAAAAVCNQKQQGWDFLKIYDAISRDAFDALMESAENEGLRVAGHISPNARLRRALTKGIWSIEHLSGYVDYTEAAESPFRGKWNWRKTWHAVAVDDARVERVAAATSEAHTWNCPTLTAWRKMLMDLDSLENDKLHYISKQRRSEWHHIWKTFSPHRSKAGREAALLGEKVRQKLVIALAKAGAGLLAGSDSGVNFVVPGFSIHEELQSLFDTGLSAYEVLCMATCNAARCLDIAGEFGTIKEGARADLVLLQDNPLDNLANLAKIEGVMTGGKWFSQQDIDGMLTSIANKRNEESKF